MNNLPRNINEKNILNKILKIIIIFFIIDYSGIY